MIISKKIYPSLVDVFYGNTGFKSQEWVRCTYTKKLGWRINEYPKYLSEDEYKYPFCKHLFDMIPAIHKHLVDTYGPKQGK